MKIAYSYIRFSTKGQINGDSLTRQLSNARSYAKRHDLLLDERSYQDHGISAFEGKNAKQGALRAFLDAIDEGKIPSNCTLLVENFDRISRMPVQDALDLFSSITKRGVTIVTLTDERSYSRSGIAKDWVQLLPVQVAMARAHEESAVKSMRAKSGKLAALADGRKHGKCPFWLEVAPDRRSFRILEDKADIVRQCFQMRLDGIGSLRLAQHLNTKFGFGWGTSQAARLLKNPAVIGTRLSQVGGDTLFDYYPSIIDKTLFYGVQRLMTATLGTRRGRRREDEANLFPGIVRCAKCDSPMRFFRASSSVSQQYIRCVSAVTKAGCKVKGFVNYDAFEKEILAWLLFDVEDEALTLSKKPSNQAVSQAELQALREQQSRLIDLAAGGLMNTRMVADKLNAIEQQIKKLEVVVDEPSADWPYVDLAFPLYEQLHDARLAVAAGEDPEILHSVRREIRAAFARSLERIRVYPEKRVGDEHHCKFTIEYRDYEDTPTKEYKRPALKAVKGVWNTARA